MSLPSGYKRLEYIQSTGTQYIDTGFKPNQDTGITIDFQLTSASSWQCIVGAANNSSNADSYSIWHSGRYFAFYYASSNKQWSGLGNSERHVISTSKNTAVADNQNSITITYSNFKTNYPLILFASNYAGSKTYSASMKLYSCQIYDNGTLVRDFIPCQKPDGTIGLWDDVNSVFYGNAGTRTFTAGPVIAIAADASEITKLKYIQSSGTQYINTGFVPNQNTRVVIDFQMLSTGRWKAIFGSSKASNACSFTLWHSGTTFQFYYGGTHGTLGTTALSLDRHTLDCNKNVATFTDTGTTLTLSEQAAFSSIYAMCLFTTNRADELQFKADAKLYSCQIYDNGTLVRDFIATKLSDGTVGLYDKLSGLLYINAGTGTFEAGPSSLNLPVNIGGTWKDANEVFVNIGGTWKTVGAAFVNIGGTWKELG